MSGHTGSAEQHDALSRLTGARLTSVQFVLNYLILGFDERGALTSLVWPELLESEMQLSFGESGYRDKLCSFIEKVVSNATIDADETIHFEFANGTKMQIPLGAYRGAGERAILTGPKNYLLVF